MRIRTQLFLGTSLLVMALVGLGWWLQHRQLQALERELDEVATWVGETLLKAPGPTGHNFTAFTYNYSTDPHAPPAELLTPGPGQHVLIRRSFSLGRADSLPAPTPAGSGLAPTPPDSLLAPAPPDSLLAPTPADSLLASTEAKTIELRVEATNDTQAKFLVIDGLSGEKQSIPFPPSHSSRIVEATLQQGLLVSAALLALGLLAAAYFSHRVTSPLRRLAAGAEALGRGALGTRVEGNARGEMGELITAFNEMSQRLSLLEAEKSQWRAREHLAELGDLARGLGHTLRNPLHTLGLAVEELASRESGSDELVSTARAQIRRVDRWLRSFLSIGAGHSPERQTVDLGGLLEDVALEAVQQGGLVEVQVPADPVEAYLVSPALRAALANLVGNAVESAPQAAVELSPAADFGRGHRHDCRSRARAAWRGAGAALLSAHDDQIRRRRDGSLPGQTACRRGAWRPASRRRSAGWWDAC
jgi:signal transduction histidine kinase